MKLILAVVAVVLAAVGSLPYFRDVWRGRTRPHIFTWLVWTVLTGIGFAAQITGGGGPGAWATGVSALFCFLTFLAALRYGEREIVLADWLSLLGSALAGVGWLLTSGPLLAVILISITDALGFFPTFRKSWSKPEQETALTWVVASLKFPIAIMALDRLDLVTVLYPATVTTLNILFVVMVVARRKTLRERY